jgi:DNA repair ATPase RecN
MRIFGIGKKKDRPKSDTSTSGTGIALREDYLTSHDDTAGSFVPLRSGESLIQKKKDPAEVFNEAVNRLVEKLESINDNLDRQVRQNQQLVQRMDTLPEMLKSLPTAVEEQRQAFAQVAEQLRQKVARDEKVAEELAGIHENVAASTEMDVKMCENFSKFSGTLSKLDEDTVSQTEWIQQMSRTFSASERFMKYTLAKQQGRFFWIFGISLGVCFFAIVGLIIGIALLMQR